MRPEDPPTDDAAPAATADDAIALASTWLRRADAATTPAERKYSDRLRDLIEDPTGIGFTMAFVDRAARPDDDGVAAAQLRSVIAGYDLPAFLSPVDRLLLTAGARLSRWVPGIVMPLARRRMRSIVGDLVVDATPEQLHHHIDRRRAEGFGLNINLLGEAVLGEREAASRLAATKRLVRDPHVDYVSIKISAVAPQLNHWAFDDSLARVAVRLRDLFRTARDASPTVFVNLDMEEYQDLELTVAAFTRVLDEPEFHELRAGVVLQAYLPDTFGALQGLIDWAGRRSQAGGADIKIRLVKGANLAMERVDAVMHGWQQAPYPTKLETDANYKRCLDHVLRPSRLVGARIGVASHNLFDVAWAALTAGSRGVADRVDFEMLQGMAPAQSRAVRDATDDLVLYTPVVGADDFDVAISYLFRRLEENSAEGNFLRSLFSLQPGTAEFDAEAERFRAALSHRHDVSPTPRRQPHPAVEGVATPPSSDAYANESLLDPTVPADRSFALAAVGSEPAPPTAPIVTNRADIDAIAARASAATAAWRETPPAERRRILDRVADELNRRRGLLLSAMVHEGHKTVAEADVEIAEAIDFARWYGRCALELDEIRSATFRPLGTVLVVPPWNFPVAIPCGGVSAALAAGNAVILKPAPETPGCAEIVAEACWAGGVPPEVLQFVRTHDDDVGRHLVTHDRVDAVILTGALETARLFLDWKPELRLFAETSGKNALVITPNADIDVAVADLVRSAFGHSGQKCSAASLAICVGDVYDSPRFRRQLVDAVESLDVGATTEMGTVMGPVIAEPGDKLTRGLNDLDDGETWLVEPRRDAAAPHLWRPGVRLGVRPGSWFHRTECFGPVLGLMRAADLDEAIRIQNGTDFGLTGGIHSLDPDDVATWLDRVEAGNCYVNRPITGAIVRRQPFGGWKQSVVGPGLKAGGPDYLLQLGTWTAEPGHEVDDDHWWHHRYGIEDDPSGLFCEANVLRYRPLDRVVIRVGPEAEPSDVARVQAAARRCGTGIELSDAADEPDEQFAARISEMGVERIRLLGDADERVRRAANAAGVHLAADPVTKSGRLELLHYLREQAVSRTLHRFGNLVSEPPSQG